MPASPVSRKRTSPGAFTVATVVLLDRHSASEVTSSQGPLENVAVADNCIVLPTTPLQMPAPQESYGPVALMNPRVGGAGVVGCVGVEAGDEPPPPLHATSATVNSAVSDATHFIIGRPPFLRVMPYRQDTRV